SMTTGVNNHGESLYALNTGRTQAGRPSLGSWLTYGLGCETQDLPAYVVLTDAGGLPVLGTHNWSNGWLPALYQGTVVRSREPRILNLDPPPHLKGLPQERYLEYVAKLNREHLAKHPGETDLEARIASYELAARMQMSVPEATDISGETPATQTLYGLDDERTKGFGKNCLLARRLLEKGVRFVQVLNGGSFGSPRINWDGHENLKENHDAQAATMDKPVAGLIQDLKQRGLLDDTLLIWSTEFGRSPVTQGLGANGRDHHPDAFTCFLAGAGIKKGFTYGKTDDVGYSVKENPVSIYDLHATILHVLGIDHQKLTFYHNGVKRRLTDVHGEVVRDLLV
ncbi:MAG: DUF1501 domain-containing protein, partial [Verrucomicrobia bacterium]|nr:DUF1501 domain-containing protein [Verrucomicrobiota bacterium]